ncbi:transcription elongation factor A N-terminal and central domain-containing protein [Spea bombifrons]|uniref:transcription elongation factor A N-terminal and central domain-containing protein n=1 Tax=Spea bombifrons TaxID=233779 RepID=UPI00234BA260|nr:transcription elongation factor A N-terminal and central domain-containing protein [Spea bombifrons]
MLQKMNLKELTHRGSEVESLLYDRKYEDVALHLTHFENATVTIEILQNTDIVHVVYRVLKSCPQGVLKTRAKCLLSKWKASYKKSHLQTSNPNEGCPACENNNVSEEDSIEVHNSRPEIGMLNTLHSSNEKHKQINGDSESSIRQHCGEEPTLPDSGQHQKKVVVEDSVLRTRFTDLLCVALVDPTDCQEKAQNLAKEIEENIFLLHSGNDKKYRNCIRSKVSNLKNPKNHHLREQLFSGALSPKAFAEMTSMEMASEELRTLRASYTQAGVREHQLPQSVDGIQTNKVKCRKCENFDCKVTVISRGTLFLPGWVRSRNPDEEMMTFVICNKCGEQWYHSRWVCL